MKDYSSTFSGLSPEDKIRLYEIIKSKYGWATRENSIKRLGHYLIKTGKFIP